jgi:lysophospholipase L1-like esterase
MAFLIFFGACSHAQPPPPAPPAAPSQSAAPIATTIEAPIDAGPPDAGKPPPKIVLHAGDSMVGGTMGLGRALHQRFTALGSKVVRDVWVSINIEGFARHPRFAKLLRDNTPDLVILTLGANDFYVPSPKSLAPFVESIAKKASQNGRECYWIVPVPWTKAKETGIVEVVQAHAAPCRVFVGADLKLARGPDGIHPTNTGGEQWADAFFEFYESRD